MHCMVDRQAMRVNEWLEKLKAPGETIITFSITLDRNCSTSSDQQVCGPTSPVSCLSQRKTYENMKWTITKLFLVAAFSSPTS